MKNRITAALFILAGVLILGLLAYGYVVTGQRNTARAQRDAAEARHILFAERVKAKGQDMIRRVNERNRRVAAEQDRITRERTRDLQTQLADLSRRYADLLRRSAPGANPGRPGGTAGLPAVPQPGGGTAPPAGESGLHAASPAVWLTLEDAMICTANSLTLVALQAWANEQMAVDRSTPGPANPR